MAAAQLHQPSVSKNDILVVNIVKQLCTTVTGLSNGRCVGWVTGNFVPTYFRYRKRKFRFLVLSFP